MRIGIIGAGSLGSLRGGYLHANGEEVYVYDAVAEIVRAIEENGLRIEREGGDGLVVHPPASTSPAEIGEVDVAFVFTKAYDTDRAIRDAGPMVGDEATVVTVQNGLRNAEIIAEHVPEERVLGGATTMGANKIAPGHVRQHLMGRTRIVGPDREAAERVVGVLTDAGFETDPVDDPRPYVWEKQFVNMGIKPLAALTELPNGPMYAYEPTRAVMRGLVEESMAVERARGVEIVSDDPVEDTFEVCREGFEKQSSILEDVRNGNPTEIGHINGAVVEYGEEEGVATPLNRMGTALVEGKERSYLDDRP